MRTTKKSGSPEGGRPFATLNVFNPANGLIYGGWVLLSIGVIPSTILPRRLQRFLNNIEDPLRAPRKRQGEMVGGTWAMDHLTDLPWFQLFIRSLLKKPK